ncbi:hypothetical protein, partial [Shewanella indica]|uniref:hypothetical protein n=1 Tax=Shewanella indica TaxID=768528 RepID=UPI002043622E
AASRGIYHLFSPVVERTQKPLFFDPVTSFALPLCRGTFVQGLNLRKTGLIYRSLTKAAKRPKKRYFLMKKGASAPFYLSSVVY